MAFFFCNRYCIYIQIFLRGSYGQISKFSCSIPSAENRRITSAQAFEKYGITRLSSVISELRAKGYPISTEMTNGTNRYGNPVRYGVYRLPKGWSVKELENAGKKTDKN